MASAGPPDFARLIVAVASELEEWAAQFVGVPGRERILEAVADLRAGSTG